MCTVSALLVSTGVWAHQVNADVDTFATFARVKTFAWTEGAVPSGANPLMVQSLDVYIQATSPGADKESNWLPCPPSGSFNLTIRSCQPMESLLNGSYVLPPVRRMS